MATSKKVSRSKSQGKAPAAVLREQTAKIAKASKVSPPRMSTERHPATDAAEAAGKAVREIGDLQVPLTLREVCEIIGVDCKPERFAVTAFETLGGQLAVVTELTESTALVGYDAYRLTENVRHRLLLAGRVTAWLESETRVRRLPEVQP
jgi:hypothetical protein